MNKPVSDPRRATDVDEQIGRNIARRRAALGMTQSALAAHMGVSFQQVQKYETGQNRVACSRLLQIAEALNVAPADLFPTASWMPDQQTSRASLEECGRLLAQVQPAVDQALKIARTAW
jgi:transcriptional regulator with XRE-family HTH domain